MSFPSRNSNGGASAAVVALSGHNLVVVCAQIHSQLGPGIEVVSSGDSAAAALALTHTPVLGKGSSAIDGRCICSYSRVDVVSGAVAGYGALVGSTSRRVIRAV